MVEDQVEGAFLEEVGADVKIPGIFGAESERFLREAVGWDMCVCCGEDGGLDGWVGWWRVVLVGVVEGVLWAEEERSESSWRPQEHPLELRWWCHDRGVLS